MLSLPTKSRKPETINVHDQQIRLEVDDVELATAQRFQPSMLILSLFWTKSLVDWPLFFSFLIYCVADRVRLRQFEPTFWSRISPINKTSSRECFICPDCRPDFLYRSGLDSLLLSAYFSERSDVYSWRERDRNLIALTLTLLGG